MGGKRARSRRAGLSVRGGVVVVGPLPCRSTVPGAIAVDPGDDLAVLARRCSVLVLTDAALARIAPSELARLLSPALVVLAPERTDRHVLATWLRRGFTTIVPPGLLVEAIRGLFVTESAGRFEIPAEDWCPQRAEPLSDVALRAVGAVPHLRVLHDVGEWAAKLGCSRQQLWRLCRRTFAAGPQEVLGWHVLAQVEAGRSSGLRLKELARMLGYADESSLGHACERWRASRGSRSRAPSEGAHVHPSPSLDEGSGP